MSPVSESITVKRSERRIAVRLPLRVSGRDARGFSFEEETASENLCRSGAAFRTRFDVAIGSSLEIRIPVQGHAPRRGEQDFETQGKVVHISESPTDGEKVVGVFHNNQAFFSLERRYHFLHFCSLAELIVGAVNKKLRLRALCQKRKIAAVQRDAQAY